MKSITTICLMLGVLGAGCSTLGELKQDENGLTSEMDVAARAMAANIDYYLKLPESKNSFDRGICGITLGKKKTVILFGNQGLGYLPFLLKLYATFTGIFCPIKDQYIAFRIRVIPDQGMSCGAIYEVVKSDIWGLGIIEDDVFWSTNGCDLAERLIQAAEQESH